MARSHAAAHWLCMPQVPEAGPTPHLTELARQLPRVRPLGLHARRKRRSRGTRSLLLLPAPSHGCHLQGFSLQRFWRVTGCSRLGQPHSGLQARHRPLYFVLTGYAAQYAESGLTLVGRLCGFSLPNTITKPVGVPCIVVRACGRALLRDQLVQLCQLVVQLSFLADLLQLGLQDGAGCEQCLPAA